MEEMGGGGCRDEGAGGVRRVAVAAPLASPSIARFAANGRNQS